jgi:polysaccharide export outer membrane protein
MIRPLFQTPSFPLLAVRRSALRWLAALAGAMSMAIAIPCGADSRESLGTGDNIRVTVFQNPDLTTEVRISERGTIVFPLIGEIQLSGQTPAGAAARIAEQLKQGSFMKNPQVNVVVLQVRSRQVSVLGHVIRPGRYALEDSSSKLTDILALAGGIGPTGDDTVIVMISRDGDVNRLEIDVPKMYRSGDLSSNIEVQNGDTIFVQRAPVFYIYGEVQRAGAYRLEPNMAVVQALSLGGGLTPRGTERGLKIHRRMPDGTVTRLDARPVDAVQADDVIYVKESLF